MGLAAGPDGKVSAFGKHCLAHADAEVRFWGARGVLLGKGTKDSDAAVRGAAVSSYTSVTGSHTLAKKALADPESIVQEAVVEVIDAVRKEKQRTKLAQQVLTSRNVALVRKALAHLANDLHTSLRAEVRDELTRLSERHPLEEIRGLAKQLTK